MLCEAVKLVFVSEPVAIPLLERFAGVYIQDGSAHGLQYNPPVLFHPDKRL